MSSRSPAGRPRCFRIARSEQVYALHPDMKGTAKAARPIETSYLDYRRIEGFLMPTRIVNRDRRTGEVVQTVTVRSIRVNQPVEAAVFESR
ncbi:MAG: hypothetical protein ACRETT_05025 [Steroidobacteraceae bacterium]